MKKITSIVLLIILISSLYFIINNSYELNSSENMANELKSIHLASVDENEETKKNLPIILEDSVHVNTDQTFYFKQNPNQEIIQTIEDYVGWITVANTQIDYPVVKTVNNTFYLNHDYLGKENIAGAIFMDRRNLGNAFDQHTIIYGHHMKNGTMFADLNKYLDETFFNNHKIIEFKDLYKNYKYEVFSVYYVSANEYNLSYDLNKNSIEKMLNNGIYDSDYQYSDKDRFLTLSTCNYILDNGLVIVHAVLREE